MVFLICLSSAVLAYVLITSLFDKSNEDNIKRRISKLSVNDGIDGIRKTVLNEAEEKNKSGKKKGLIRVSEKLENNLSMAGVKLSAQEYLNIWIIAAVGPALLAALFGANITTVLGLSILGISTPPLLVERSRKKMQTLFNKQLGDSLMIISNCMRAGFSFQQAMESIANEMQPPISTEFSRALREIKYGVSFDDALIHMEERVQNKDFELLVTAVITATQVGANLAEILDILSTTIKDRIKLREEAKVLTSQGRFSGIIIGALPLFLTLFLMVINPEYINSFFTTSIGKVMVVVGIAMEAIGFFIINKIVQIKF